jgi:hypothetical protein
MKLISFLFSSGSSRIKEMYDLEMIEGRKLVDDTKRDGAAAHVKTQQAELEVKRQRARYAEISGLRESDRKEVDSLQLRIAENEAVSLKLKTNLENLKEKKKKIIELKGNNKIYIYSY